MENKEAKITHEKPTLTSNTSYYEVEITINDKLVIVSRWFSFDEDIGETDEGFEILELEDFAELTDEEKQEIEDYLYSNKINF